MMRILIVEDDEALSESLCAVCRMMRHDVATVASLAEAVAALGREPFDLVIADHMLDGPYRGMDLLRWLDRHHPQLPFVLMSGAPVAGFHPRPPLRTFLPKPFFVSDLERLLSRPVAMLQNEA